jgi:hypothetical protein
MNYRPTNIEREQLEWMLQRYFGVGIPFVIVDYCLAPLVRCPMDDLWSIEKTSTGSRWGTRSRKYGRQSN